MIFLSGAAPTDAGGQVVGEGDMGAQAQACLTKLQGILESAGAAIDDVVFMTAYVTDMDRIDEVEAVRMRFLEGPVLPALSFYEVSRLAHPQWLVEIDGVAVVNGGEER